MNEAAAQDNGRGLVVLLVAALVALALISLALGPARLAPELVVRALWRDEGAASLIVREIRLPRTLLALTIGAGLGLAGAALQGLMRNPLAEPAVFGAPHSASFGAVLALHFAGVPALDFALPVAAIAGALASVAVVVAIAGATGGVVAFVLAGLAVASFAGAATALAISLAANPFAVTELVFWLMGSLEERSFRHVMLFMPFALTGMAMLFAQGQALRALTLGEETAASLGEKPARARVQVVIAVALIVGASVAVAGAIGFVGLVAPHVARLIFGADPKRLLLPSLLIGALLLLAADMFVRVLPAASELRLGVVTALIGVPVFLALVVRRHGGEVEP
jgi:iron complex transport system permease protein